MSGSCVGLSSSIGSQKATFFDGWYWVVGLNPAGVSLFRMPRPLHVLQFNLTEAEAAIPSPPTTWFCMFLGRFRSCLSGDAR